MINKSLENPSSSRSALLTENRDFQQTIISNPSSFRVRGPQKMIQIMKRDEFQNIHNSLDNKLDKRSPKIFSLSPIIITKKRNNDRRSELEEAREELESRDSQSDPNYYKSRLKTPMNHQNRTEDMKPKEMIGQAAISKFYHHYKKLDKIKDQNKYNAINDSIYTAFLNKSESLNLLPSKIGFIKMKGDEDKLKMKYIYIFI